MRKFKIFVVLSIALGMLWSCEFNELSEENQMKPSESKSMFRPDDLNFNARLAPENICGTDTFNLTAGRTIDAGYVAVANDESNLEITVYSDAGFQDVKEEVKIWLGTDITTVEGAGQSRPPTGHFPYKTDVASDTYTVEAIDNGFVFTIPLSVIDFYDESQCGQQAIFILVHADVLTGDGTKEETAWGGNTPGNTSGTGNNGWWFYDTYTPACCEDTPPPPPDGSFQTAFAYGTHVFTISKKSNPDHLKSLNLTQNRWGWAINLTAPGEYSYDIWAGAGLNYTSKGTLVGTLTVDWDGNNATITYSFNTGYYFDEVHVYAGDNAPQTVAPGQYGFIETFDPMTDSYSVTLPVEDTNGGGVWIIAHAVAYGNF